MKLYRRDYLLLFLILFMLALSTVKTVKTNEMSTQGNTLAELQREIEEYRQKNLELRVEILEHSSYRVIMEKAKNQGFQQLTDDDYVILK